MICSCLPGFYGPNCSLSSPCSLNPCLNGGTCLIQASSPNGYSCSCLANYFGTNCQVLLTLYTCNAPDGNSTLCSYWATNGFCNYQYSYNQIPLPVYCPNSCKLCTQIQNCIDSQSSCTFWASSGLCNTVNNVNQNLCRKSCNNCPA